MGVSGGMWLQSPLLHGNQNRHFKKLHRLALFPNSDDGVAVAWQGVCFLFVSMSHFEKYVYCCFGYWLSKTSDLELISTKQIPSPPPPLKRHIMKWLWNAKYGPGFEPLLHRMIKFQIHKYVWVVPVNRCHQWHHFGSVTFPNDEGV